MSRTVEITVNGETQRVDEGTSLMELVRSLELAPERVAVERNRQIVPRARWVETVIEQGDALEIVHFVGGGLECDAGPSHSKIIGEPAAASASPPR